jgi:hypothetical protein
MEYTLLLRQSYSLISGFWLCNRRVGLVLSFALGCSWKLFQRQQEQQQKHPHALDVDERFGGFLFFLVKTMPDFDRPDERHVAH